MKYDPQLHHRRSIRLQGYDYTAAGAYFITICSYQREHIFGEVVDGEMKLHAWGDIARAEWFKTAELRSQVELHEDEFVVMPNHVHGIVWLKEEVGALRRSALLRDEKKVSEKLKVERPDHINWQVDRDNSENTRKLPAPESIVDYLKDAEEILGVKTI